MVLMASSSSFSGCPMLISFGVVAGDLAGWAETQKAVGDLLRSPLDIAPNHH